MFLWTTHVIPQYCWQQNASVPVQTGFAAVHGVLCHHYHVHYCRLEVLLCQPIVLFACIDAGGEQWCVQFKLSLAA